MGSIIPLDGTSSHAAQEMRVWPLEVGLQEQASNRLKLLSLATRRTIWGLSAEGCADRSGAESFWPQVKC